MSKTSFVSISGDLHVLEQGSTTITTVYNLNTTNKKKTDETKSVGISGDVHVPAKGTLTIKHVYGQNAVDEKKMDEYLKPLNGRRFQDRKCFTESLAGGKMIDMNIVIVNLPEEDRQKILDTDGENYEDDGYSLVLNGVELNISDLSKGSPVGFSNYRFKDWKLSQITFSHLKS